MQLLPTFHVLLQGHSGIESICNAGDAGLIPGLGGSPGGRKIATHPSILT